jgi:hypothetical protein
MDRSNATADHRVCEVELEGLNVCWERGARPSLAKLRLRKWAHLLGFGGHFSTRAAATRPEAVIPPERGLGSI